MENMYNIKLDKVIFFILKLLLDNDNIINKK